LQFVNDAMARESGCGYDELLYEANAPASPDSSSKKRRSAHQGWICQKPGTVEIGCNPWDSRAMAATAGTGRLINGTAW
jgi:hypothetical protein